MALRVTWDAEKAAANLKKHGISFEEARDIFEDPLRKAWNDEIHSDEEDRFVAVGAAASGKLLFVSYALRESEVRIISARKPTRSQRRRYMDEKPTIHDEPLDPFDEEMAHIDWSKGVRGLHYIPPQKGDVTLDEDVYRIFQTSEEVNNALRILIRENRIPHFVSDEEWFGRKKDAAATAPPTSRPSTGARRGGGRRR